MAFRNPLGFATSYIRSAVGRVVRTLGGPLSRIGMVDSIISGLGSSLGSIGRALAGVGAEIEASALRREALREAEIAAATGSIEGIPRGTIIEDSDIAEAVTKIRRQYAWTVRVRYIDPTTGERRERYITVSTDKRLSADEAIRAAQEETFPESPKIGGAVIESDIIRVVRAGPQGTL